MSNIKVTTTKVKQEANTVLGTPEKTLYYLILSKGEEKFVINVGEKTYTKANELLKDIEELKPKK